MANRIKKAKALFSVGKRLGSEQSAGMDERRAANQFKKINDGFGGKRKGNTLNKAAVIAGAVAGTAGSKVGRNRVGNAIGSAVKSSGAYKMTSARKAALMKAVKASAAKRRRG